MENVTRNLPIYIARRNGKKQKSILSNVEDGILPNEPNDTISLVDATSVQNIQEKFKLDSTPLELILLKYFEQHNEVNEQKLCKVLGITIETLDDFYIKYLPIFKDKMPYIIERMITRDSNNVDRIFTKSYLKDYLLYLTEKEKMYWYLKLKSYADPKLTDEEISQMVGITLQDLESYEIMTPYDVLNQFNQFIKK